MVISSLTSNENREQMIFVVRLCSVLGLILLAGFELFVTDASALSLYKQIQSGVENKHLECTKQNHQIVVRSDFRFACVTAESGLRLGWSKVIFSDDNGMIVNSTSEVDVNGVMFQINTILKNGLIQKIWHHDFLDTLLLKINSTEAGEIKLKIPQSFFTWYDPGDNHSMKIVVYETETMKDIIPNAINFVDDSYVVEFSFSDTDPTFEIDLRLLY